MMARRSNMSHHIARSFGAAVSILHMAALMASVAALQGFGPRLTIANGYKITVVHDRLTDSSHLTAPFIGSSKPFGLESKAWLDLSFSFAEDRLLASPPLVVLSIESWTPSRGRWASAHPQSLEIRSGNSLRLEMPPAGYEKRPVHMFDAGRREVLWLEIDASDLRRIADAPELVLTAGHARFGVRKRMEMLREVVRRMTPLERGPQ
jgi:hypothetical protein